MWDFKLYNYYPKNLNLNQLLRLISTHTPEEEDRVDNRNFVKQQAKGELRRNFFSFRVVDQWNNLPSAVKNAENVNNFKNLYDSWVKGNE